jgi:hypothetical protein
MQSPQFCVLSARKLVGTDSMRKVMTRTKMSNVEVTSAIRSPFFESWYVSLSKAFISRGAEEGLAGEGFPICDEWSC